MTEAIEFVLHEADGKPLSSKEIFARLPCDVIDLPEGALLDTKLFWQFFGMFLKNHAGSVGWVRLGNGKRGYFYFGDWD